MIPNWTLQGIVPPFVGGDPTILDNMSPYLTTMKAFAQRFGDTPERRNIINGLLDYRAALLAAGLTGFQWLSGSFVEKVESLRGRPPGDVDVVSLLNRPTEYIPDDKWLEFLGTADGNLLINPEGMKRAYHCDAYIIDLNEPGLDIANITSYWYGLFSHQRETSVWKGMVIVKLDPQQDTEARSILSPTADLATS
jgi:hypothetical protein